MRRPRLILTTLALFSAVLAGCGDSSETADDAGTPSDTPSQPATSSPQPETPPSSPSTPSRPDTPEVQVTVGPPEDSSRYATAMLEHYTQFETAFWNSLAAGEVSAELRSLTSADALVGVEQAITGQPNPRGGTVTVSPALDDLVIADIGMGPMATQATITGCSDQSGLSYEGGSTGASSTILASISWESGSYLVTNYALGPDAC